MDSGTSCSISPSFIPPAFPENEADRKRALDSLRLLDTPTEDRFDRIVRLAAQVFDAPMVYVALVDSNRQWLKSKVGLEVQQTGRDVSFCGHAILQEKALIVPDARRDIRFAGNPLVINEPFVRFYAGRPVSAGGFRVGTLCVLDRKPRSMNDKELQVLDRLGELVEHEFRLVETIELQKTALEAQKALAESERRLAQSLQQLEAAKDRADDLLRTLLPSTVADQLQTEGLVKPIRHENVALMFADFSGFTLVAAETSPDELVSELDECFCHFDWTCERNGVEKLKTVGDGYVCAAGLNSRAPDDAERLLRVALEIRDYIAGRHAEFKARGKAYWNIRIGLHSGPLVSGIVGVRKFAYDIWGDTVNTTARIETAGVPGRINASMDFLRRVQDKVEFEPRGYIACKHKGDIEMAFINGFKA